MKTLESGEADPPNAWGQLSIKKFGRSAGSCQIWWFLGKQFECK